MSEVVIHLPYPPSVNRLWRNSGADATSRVYLSPKYVEWKKHADALLMSVRGWASRRIEGKFTIEIDLCPPPKYPRGDLDNRIKAVLDFLQRATVIQNDKLCERLIAQWVDRDQAPYGCRATITPHRIATMAEVLRRAEVRAE